ncbi:Signal peptidase I [Pedobacter cryoconitis]|uniref:Signal peptidase I n=1 Tax=Pedobacter cryoconitis TaxID=188932 RepID=A0A127V9L4_9SPHI|nr:signal peptidase I [Pedobacter cryoconitis]AMP98043.1 Signal peptidase I [Pedobacter cryoconitis]
MKTLKSTTYFISIILIGFVLYVFIIKRFFIVYRVDQHSMENTLIDGDKVLVKLTDNISKNDIVIFQYNNTAFIKRLIGNPGDSLYIKNNIVYVNNQNIVSLYNLKNGASNSDKDIMILNSFGKRWTLSNWGPVVIPKKGVSIKLTSDNYSIYQRIIEEEQRKNINFQQLKDVSYKYTFKHNYIFVLGDNRLHSDDSRLFGFIPTANIIGKTNLVLFSMSDISRIFKTIK